MLPWSELRKVGRNKVVNNSFYFLFFVPALANAIEGMEGTLLEPYLFDLPFSWTILYISAVLFGLGTSLFYWLCPKIIFEFEDYSNYKNRGFDISELIDMLKKDDLAIDRLGLINDWLLEHSDSVSSGNIERDEAMLVELDDDRTYLILKSKEASFFWRIRRELDDNKPVVRAAVAIIYSCGFMLFGWVFLQNLSSVISYSIG